MNAELVTVLSGIITAALALVFFYFPWQSLVVDQTRQRIFEIRDRWFDYSQSLTDPADKAAAAAVRDEMNYLIRLTHHMTFPALIIMNMRRFFVDVGTFENPLTLAINGFKSGKAAEEAKRAMNTVFAHISWCMIRRSLLALALMPIALLITFLFSTTSSGLSALAACLENMTEQAANQAHQNGKYA